MKIYQIWAEGPLEGLKRSKELSSTTVYKTYAEAAAACPAFLELCVKAGHDRKWLHYNIIELELAE